MHAMLAMHTHAHPHTPTHTAHTHTHTCSHAGPGSESPRCIVRKSKRCANSKIPKVNGAASVQDLADRLWPQVISQRTKKDVGTVPAA